MFWNKENKKKQYKNWKVNGYVLQSNKEIVYDWRELRDYFYIDGSEVCYCKKDFGNCKADQYYMVKDMSDWPVTYGFVISDWIGFDEWIGCEYMREKYLAEKEDKESL